MITLYRVNMANPTPMSSIILRDFYILCSAKTFARVIIRQSSFSKLRLDKKFFLSHLPYPVVSQIYKKQIEMVKHILIILHGKIIMLVKMLVISSNFDCFRIGLLLDLFFENPILYFPLP